MNRRKFLVTFALGGISFMTKESSLAKACLTPKQKKRGSGFDDERSKKVIFVEDRKMNEAINLLTKFVLE
jgi:hypothetical protein